MPYFTYVLYSQKFGRYYKGHCESLNRRLAWHNAGKTKSTRPYRPWKIIYYERFETREEAIARERYFKTAAGRKYLGQKIKQEIRGSPPD